MANKALSRLHPPSALDSQVSLGQDPALLEQGQEAWEKPPSARAGVSQVCGGRRKTGMQSWKEWEEKTQQPTCHLSLIDFPCRTLSHAASHAAVPHFPEAILHSAVRGKGRLEKWQNCVLMERRHRMELLGASDMDPKKPPKT